MTIIWPMVPRLAHGEQTESTADGAMVPPDADFACATIALGIAAQRMFFGVEVVARA
jgi:hypothetical protein